jgi:hypothetical protein
MNPMMNLLSHKGKVFLSQMNLCQLGTKLVYCERQKIIVIGGNFFM